MQTGRSKNCSQRLPIVVLLMLVIASAVAQDNDSSSSCGLWLGPSHIKEREKHGYGLGMYTGRMIRKGEVLPSEIFIPVFDFDYDEDDHPPLREYFWDGESFKQITLEALEGMLFYSPGLAAIAPCTTSNYNLERNNVLEFDNAGIHRSRDPTIGTFTYFTAPLFRAVRDIQPGEELTVECTDDQFDGSSELWTYDPKQHFCLDDKLVQRSQSNIPGVARGVFAKTALSKNSLLLSSPAVPLLRDTLNIKTIEPVGIQLLMNYCFGHPDSDLLWLPYGPFINSINHSSKNPNVKVQWHADPLVSNKDLERRKQYHHPELLEYSTDRVAKTHGKGLMMDLVALRDIQPGEELYLDYGPSWEDAWNYHSSRYRSLVPKMKDVHHYIPAPAYNALHAKDPVRTITEQHKNPYPFNVLTACRFEKDWIEDENAEDYDMIQYHSWHSQEKHFVCLLPCLILERLQDEEDPSMHRYTAKLVDQHHDNLNIEYECNVFRRFEYIYTDIPREGIEFIETTYHSDALLPIAFRQPIQVPDGMYPDQWVRQRVRRRVSANPTPPPEEDGNIFKRKDIEIKYNMEDILRKKEESARTDL